MIRRSAFLLLLASALLFSGCATRQLGVKNPDSLYDRFQKQYTYGNATGIKARASLYYTSADSGHRTTMTLWGNPKDELRLDVMAGIGAYIAHIHEDSSGLTAFYPEQKAAYSHPDPVRGVKLLGLPFPFSLKDLAGLVCGCYQFFIPDNFDSVNAADENGNTRYYFNSGPVSSITLAGPGFPVEINGRGENAWDIKFDSNDFVPDAGKYLPAKISVFMKNGDKAVLRVKSRKFSHTDWPEDSLKMKLPDGTETIPLNRSGSFLEN